MTNKNENEEFQEWIYKFEPVSQEAVGKTKLKFFCWHKSDDTSNIAEHFMYWDIRYIQCNKCKGWMRHNTDAEKRMYRKDLFKHMFRK